MEDPTLMIHPSRLMLIDDNESDLILLREAISESGWNVEISEARNRKQALDSLHRLALTGTPPDLILTDYHLASESCLGMIQELRAHASFESMPVVVVSTTMPPESMRERFYSLGVLKVLMKAYSYTALVSMVGALRMMLNDAEIMSPGGSRTSDANLVLASGA